jgi:hypothetical protein
LAVALSFRAEQSVGNLQHATHEFEYRIGIILKIEWDLIDRFFGPVIKIGKTRKLIVNNSKVFYFIVQNPAFFHSFVAFAGHKINADCGETALQRMP